MVFSIVENMKEKCISEEFQDGESHEDVKKRVADFLDIWKSKYNGKHVAVVARKSPQLALGVLLKNKTWDEAFADGWRKTKSWRPGLEYVMKS